VRKTREKIANMGENSGSYYSIPGMSFIKQFVKASRKNIKEEIPL